MANRKRNIMVRFRVTPEEKAVIEEKMAQVGTTNMEAYLRKMSIDGWKICSEIRNACGRRRIRY